MFWPSIGKRLVECFNILFEKGKLSSSQNHAVITLIQKKDLDRCDLKNWRPISLLNVDAKIASKVIVERMKRLRPCFIHHSQTVSNPNCTFCKESQETIHHILFVCSFSKCFWSTVSSWLLNRVGSCWCLSIRDIMIGILKEGMDF